jgi:hypothetical protein
MKPRTKLILEVLAVIAALVTAGTGIGILVWPRDQAAKPTFAANIAQPHGQKVTHEPVQVSGQVQGVPDHVQLWLAYRLPGSATLHYAPAPCVVTATEFSCPEFRIGSRTSHRKAYEIVVVGIDMRSLTTNATAVCGIPKPGRATPIKALAVVAIKRK